MNNITLAGPGRSVAVNVDRREIRVTLSNGLTVEFVWDGHQPIPPRTQTVTVENLILAPDSDRDPMLAAVSIASDAVPDRYLTVRRLIYPHEMPRLLDRLDDLSDDEVKDSRQVTRTLEGALKR